MRNILVIAIYGLAFFIAAESSAATNEIVTTVVPMYGNNALMGGPNNETAVFGIVSSEYSQTNYIYLIDQNGKPVKSFGKDGLLEYGCGVPLGWSGQNIVLLCSGKELYLIDIKSSKFQRISPLRPVVQPGNLSSDVKQLNDGSIVILDFDIISKLNKNLELDLSYGSSGSTPAFRPYSEYNGTASFAVAHIFVDALGRIGNYIADPWEAFYRSENEGYVFIWSYDGKNSLKVVPDFQTKYKGYFEIVSVLSSSAGNISLYQDWDALSDAASDRRCDVGNYWLTKTDFDFKKSTVNQKLDDVCKYKYVSAAEQDGVIFVLKYAEPYKPRHEGTNAVINAYDSMTLAPIASFGDNGSLALPRNFAPQSFKVQSGHKITLFGTEIIEDAKGDMHSSTQVLMMNY